MSAGLLAADLLTWTRLVLAVALPVALWTARPTLASVLLATAWISDVLDGRLARLVGGEGRMGRWDLMVDTAVGAGALIGLAGAGDVPVWLAVGAVLLFGGWWLARANVAASMLLQLSGYLPLLWVLCVEHARLWWLPTATAALIGIVDWRRLLEVSIPSFLRGLRPRGRGRVA